MTMRAAVGRAKGNDATPRRPTIRATLAASAALVVVACGEPRQVSDSGFGAYEVSLATRGEDGFAAAWYDTRDGNAEVYVRFLDEAGHPVGPDRRLTNTGEQSYEADIAALADGIAVAWYEKTAAGVQHARLGAWNRDLEPRWSIPLGDPSRESRNPAVRAGADGLFVAWIERMPSGEEVRAAWYGFDGTPRGESIAVGRVADTTWNLNAALGSHDTAFVAYDARVDTAAEELFLAEVTADGAKLARLTSDDGFASKYPDIAIAGSQFALTWFDERDGNQEVYLAQGYLKVDLRAETFDHARRVTSTPGSSIGAYVAWNRARIGLAWSDDSSGSHEVYFQSFAENGKPLGDAARLTNNPTSSLIPAIKPWRDGFALAWTEVTLGGNGAHDPETRSEVMFSLTP
jgi:hypothetical protein